MNILIAEDDPTTQRIFQDRIEDLGHTVCVVSDGEEAWRRIQQGAVQVVISDWRMPRLDGLGLCRRIRQNPGDAYVYFILITVEGGYEQRAQAIREEVDDFMTKPVDATELAMRIRVAERILSFGARVERLESLLPVCSYCKGIRQDKEYWQRVETYLAETTGLQITHSICLACFAKHVQPQVEKLRAKKLSAG